MFTNATILDKSPLPWMASPKDFSGSNNLGVAAKETTQRYIYGTRYMTWDGKVFKYGHAAVVCQSGYGARNYAGVNISHALPAAPVTTTVGQTTLVVTVDSNDGYSAASLTGGSGIVAENELVGGYVVVGNNLESPENFTIMGNTAVASGGGTTILTLDRPMSIAYTGSTDYCEVLYNPYAHLAGNTVNDNYFSVMGVPATQVTAAYNSWFQTWGPLWLTPTGAAQPGSTASDREFYFLQQNGAIVSGTTAVVETGWQRGGFIIEWDAAGAAGPPFCMLQLSI